MAWKPAIDQVCPLYKKRSGNQMMMIKVRQTDCQLYACAKKSKIRLHGRNVLQEIAMGS